MEILLLTWLTQVKAGLPGREARRQWKWKGVVCWLINHFKEQVKEKRMLQGFEIKCKLWQQQYEEKKMRRQRGRINRKKERELFSLIFGFGCICGAIWFCTNTSVEKELSVICRINWTAVNIFDYFLLFALYCYLLLSDVYHKDVSIKQRISVHCNNKKISIVFFFFFLPKWYVWNVEGIFFFF